MTRTRGTGTFRRRKDGLYAFRYYDASGRQVTAPVAFKTKADGWAWNNDRLAKVSRGEWSGARESSELLRVFAEREMATRNYTHLTRDRRSWLWAKFVDPAFGDWPLTKITLTDVEQWRSGLLTNGTGAPTVRLAYNLLKSLMAAAEDKELIRRNPCRIKGASTPHTPKRRHVSYADCMAVIAHLPPHLRPLATVAWWSAARKGEVLGLQWRDVDLDTGELHICRQIVQVGAELYETVPKWHSDRFVTIDGPGLDVLREHHENTRALAKASNRVVPATDRVFTNSRGLALTPHALDLAWRVARSDKQDAQGRFLKANLPHVAFHDLRRSSATAMLASGMSIYDLMVILGHQNITTTQRYLLDDPSARPTRAAGLAAYIARTSVSPTAEVTTAG